MARGAPKSACFIGDGRSARLVGVTGQFLGRSEEGLRVVYRGSIGPLPVADRAREAIASIGEVLASAFGLRGLFGVDLKLDGPTPWPVEINPRYTASVEVLEEGLGLSLLAEHARAFGAMIQAGSSEPVADGRPTVAAKFIVNATRAAVVPDDWPWSDLADPRPTVADIPRGGTILHPGDPVLTVLARGPDKTRLKAMVRLWKARIDAWPSP